MVKKCSTCGYEIKDDKIDRCPRCYSIILKYPTCIDCKGCSIKGCTLSTSKTKT
jgi:hypothetical protein